MKWKTALVLCLFVGTMLTGCHLWSRQPEIGEYPPAIMAEGRVYWISSRGDVASIGDDCTVIGQISTVSAPTRPPEEEGEAIGFSDDFLDTDIYRSEDEDTIYVFNPELQRYIELVGE